MCHHRRVHNGLSWQKSSFCSSNACVEVARTLSGGAYMRDSKDPTIPALAFNAKAWRAFVEGVKAGEFDV